MFSLSEKEENKIAYQNVEYEVDISFNNIINILSFFKEGITNANIFYSTFFKLIFYDQNISINPKDAEEVFNVVFENFIKLSGQESKTETDIQGNPMPTRETKSKADYDLEFDADLIYSAFMQSYKIDLIEQQGILTWHKFNALLNGLPSNTRFMEVRDIRTCELPSGKGSTKDRQRVEKLKKRYALPNLERKESEENG